MAQETSVELPRRQQSDGSRTTVPHVLFWVAAVLLVFAAILVGLSFEYAASFLRVNAAERSDVIVVLGGGLDDSRYWRGVELMKAGYAPMMILDAEEGGEKYGKSNAQLAREFLDHVHAENTSVCPVYADSTYGETVDVAHCLAPLHVSYVLIVTADYHTRRALSIFKARLPNYHWSIADAYAPVEDGSKQRLAGDNWWKNRRWAKTIFEEWQKLIWWELVERWKPHLVVQALLFANPSSTSSLGYQSAVFQPLPSSDTVLHLFQRK